MKYFLSLLIITLAPLSAYADKENLKIYSKTDKERAIVFEHEGEKITITRKRTKCSPINGWIQELIPAPGITPVAEFDVIESMKDPKSILVDMRNEDHYLEGTIPTSVHIPFTEVSFRLDELGCTKENKKWNCEKAKDVYGYCNGPACPQSSMAMKRMIKAGFPASKIYYYRGGIMDWKNLGFTISQPY